MKIKTNALCTYGICGALIFALKIAMAPLPNIEPVSLLLTICTIVFGWNVIYPLVVYVLLEILVYGFSFWSIGYLYIWLILVVVVKIIFTTSSSTNIFLWATVSGFYGLMFGALYIPLYLITGGCALAITWWINGIMYDVIHGISNFILCLVVFKPISNILLLLNKKYLN